MRLKIKHIKGKRPQARIVRIGRIASDCVHCIGSVRIADASISNRIADTTFTRIFTIGIPYDVIVVSKYDCLVGRVFARCFTCRNVHFCLLLRGKKRGDYGKPLFCKSGLSIVQQWCNRRLDYVFDHLLNSSHGYPKHRLMD
uniref:SFRICE_013070 n=1 Tax=Spodoptera frugiperda TaxID=7108 RepID=A0A2H1V8I0_SPOFR